MTSISAALGAAAAPNDIEIDGKAYLLNPIVQKTKSQLERWLVKRAVGTITDIREELTEKEFTAAIKAIGDSSATGEYSWNGPLVLKALETMHGMCKLISLISVDPETNMCVPPETIEKWLLDEKHRDLVLLAYKTVNKESFPEKKAPDKEAQTG